MDFEVSDFDTSDEENDILALEKLNAALDASEDPRTSALESSSVASGSICSTSSSYEELAKVETAIAFNKMCEEKVRKLESLLHSRLAECRRRLAKVQSTANCTNFEKEDFRYVTCGKPYFKDSRGFPAPDNEDTLLMNKLQMYDCSGITSVASWTAKDKTNLKKVIYEMSKEIKKKELAKQISNLDRENKSSNTKKNNKAISALKREMSKVDKMPLKELALPIDEDYDWELIAAKMNNRHSAKAYSSLWKLFLHPILNKSVWTKSEHTSLQRIAYEHNLQDWDTISKELGTGRSNYQCFVYFRTNMDNTFTGGKWTKEEEEYLKRLIEYYKEDNYIPWGKVAAAMECRTKVQIYNKFARLCELRKGKFLPEEDSVILTCVEHFGKNFRKVTEYLQGRSVIQCRDRYKTLSKRFSAVWTVEEDKRLLQLVATNDDASIFSTITKFFPGKDRTIIRTRYLTLDKWLKRHPKDDIVNAPRRGARRLCHGKSTEDLNKAIECLKKRLQCAVIDTKKKKITRESTEEVICDAVRAVATTFLIMAREAQKAKSSQDENDGCPAGGLKKKCDINMLQTVLLIMRAKLNRNKFANSPSRNTYQGLLDSKFVANASQFRTYSKKNSDQKKLNSENKYDIWGNATFEQAKSLFPPHYATIIGCKKLMSIYLGQAREEEAKHVNTLIKRNAIFKAELDSILERMHSMFLWPMTLSNRSPEDCKRDYKPNLNKANTVDNENNQSTKDYNLVAPRPDWKTIKNMKSGGNNIDAAESKDSHQIDIDECYFESLL